MIERRTKITFDYNIHSQKDAFWKLGKDVFLQVKHLVCRIEKTQI